MYITMRLTRRALAGDAAALALSHPIAPRAAGGGTAMPAIDADPPIFIRLAEQVLGANH